MLLIMLDQVIKSLTIIYCLVINFDIQMLCCLQLISI